MDASTAGAQSGMTPRLMNSPEADWRCPHQATAPDFPGAGFCSVSAVFFLLFFFSFPALFDAFHIEN